METCIGACNVNTQGVIPAGPVKKQVRGQAASAAASAFSAIMAGFAGVFLSTRPEGAPVAEGPEGSEDLTVSAWAGMSPICQGLSGRPVPVKPESGSLWFLPGLESDPGVVGNPVTQEPELTPSEANTTPFHGRAITEGKTRLVGSGTPPARGLQGQPGVNLSGLQLEQVSHELWEPGLDAPAVTATRAEPVPEPGQVLPNEPGILEEARSYHHDAFNEALGVVEGEAGPEAAGALVDRPGFQEEVHETRQVEPRSARGTARQVEPNRFEHKAEELADKPERKDGPGQSIPVFSLKVQTEQVQAGGCKASVQDAGEVADTLAEAAKDGLPKTVEFRLDPPGLGRITVVVSAKGEEVCVKFIASSYGSHNVLAGSRDALAHALSQRGLVLAGFFVDHGMAGQGHGARYESQPTGRPAKPAAYDGVQEQFVIGETVISSSVLDYRV
ncbi:MAG: flagellar hook-length control protein FliK [Bacillota bacterium]|jgi:hypothetical protein|nr:flagellar hook-length control protein FliK [Candidatus Fermentithermobacillaceae bacterium]